MSRISDRREVAAATIAVAASRIVGFPLALLVTVWLTRELPREEFAFFGILATVSILFSMFAQGGFQTGVVRMLGEAEAGDRSLRPPAVVYASIVVTLLLAIALAVAFYFVGPQFMPSVGDDSAYLFLISAILLVVRSVNTVTAQTLRGVGRVGMSSNLSGQGQQGGLVRCVLLLLGFLLADMFGYLSLENAIWISIAASVLVSIFAIILVLRHTGIRSSVGEILQTAKVRRRDNFNMMVSEALVYWTSASAALVVGGAFVNAVMLAGVVAAFQLRNIITSPLTIIAGATPKILIKLHREGEREELELVLRATATLAFLLCLTGTLVLLAIGPSGFEFIFGNGYSDAFWHFAIMAVGIVFYIYCGMAGQALLLMGDTRVQRRAMTIALVITLPMYVILAISIGSYGVSIGLSASMILQQVLLLRAVKRTMNVDPRAYLHPRDYVRTWEIVKEMSQSRTGRKAGSMRAKAAPAILVTGAPRSGTTVVGELLSAAPGAIELYEPMSDIVGDKAVPSWFPIPGEEGFDEATADDLVARIVRRRLRCGWRPEAIQGTQGRNRFLNRTRRTAMLARLQPWKPTQVWKDPMALLLAPRLARAGQIPVIITVRDPLSLASSYKRMDWRPPVEGLVERMQRAGMEIDPRIPDLVKGDLDPMRAGAIAWNLFYRILLGEMRTGLPATVIRNADLMTHPEEVRQRLIAVTGLAVPEPVEAAEDSGDTSADLPQKAHIANRSLESVTQYWKKTLSEEEVAFGRMLNDDLWAELEQEIERHRESW